MAIGTYAQLQTAVADHLMRADLNSFFPDLITLAEGTLNFGLKGDGYDISPLRTRDMETTSTLEPTSGVVTLPSTFIEPRRVVEVASIRRPLEYLTPEMADYYYPTRSSGLANHYTIIGSSLYTFPLASNDIEVQHYRTIPPLASNDPNWLLTKSPGIYLRATLVQAALFLQEAAQAALHLPMLKALVAGMNATDRRASDANAGVYLRGPTP